MIGIDVELPISYTEELIKNEISNAIGTKYDTEFKILRRELIIKDGKPLYKLRAGVFLDERMETRLSRKLPTAKKIPSLELCIRKTSLPCRPIVVGSGPCGLFAALTFAEAGTRPILIERGDEIEKRRRIVSTFDAGGELDEESNIQFGEGGAGTFSDGKLKHGAMDGYIRKVLSEFTENGAPEEIMYDTLAHVGTDLLSEIIKKIRNKIISLGGEVMFRTKLTDLTIENSTVKGAVCKKDGKEIRIDSEIIVLATGHSARDTFRMLIKKGIVAEPKGFGIGVRIEHPRHYVDKIIYGEAASEIQQSASYRFVTHLKNGRSVYSFCMCPGGSVVAATSKNNAVVTNGMSLNARNGENSNAAFLVSVFPSDFGNTALGGIELQERLEENAFRISEDYKAPAMRMEDFLENRVSRNIGQVIPTYPRGVTLTGAENFLPNEISLSLREAIRDFDDYKKGFYMPDAMLTGVETRTTSPIKLIRNDIHEAVGVSGLFPAGEGAGYSGGIVSSAVDGIKTAECILNR